MSSYVKIKVMKIIKAIFSVIGEKLGNTFTSIGEFILIMGAFVWIFTGGGIAFIVNEEGNGLSLPGLTFCLLGWIIVLIIWIQSFVEKVKEKLNDK